MEEDFDIRQEQGRKGEKDFENALRPLRFGDFSGQQKVVENLEVFVEAAKYRGEPLDHTLLHGPPGLGKTNAYGCTLKTREKSTKDFVFDFSRNMSGQIVQISSWQKVCHSS
jgi:Holliday junction resolvasome RuvABC ATP-dependent DNA helicase subunit